MEKGEGLAFQGDKDKKKDGLLREDLWLNKTGCSTVTDKGKQCGQKSKHEIERTRAILPFHGVWTLCSRYGELMKGKALHSLFAFYKNPPEEVWIRRRIDWRQQNQEVYHFNYKNGRMKVCGVLTKTVSLARNLRK